MFNFIGSIGTHASLAALPGASSGHNGSCQEALVSFSPQTSDVVDRGAAGGLISTGDGPGRADKVDFRSSDITGSKRSPRAVNGSFPVPRPGQGFS